MLMTLYKKGFPLLPSRARQLFSTIDYRLASKPTVYHDPHLHPPRRLRRGAVTMSLDFEMAWAWLYSKRNSEDFVAKGLRERENVPVIVSKFDEYGFPATWATVGHLFLDRCVREKDGLAHAGMPRMEHFETVRWNFRRGDWFQFDPCTDVRRDPAWYAPDLIEKILNARTKHEIGCHAFSHAGFGAYCPPEVAAAELKASKEAMASFGLVPKTLVFPRHDEGNFEALAAAGFEIVRAFPLGKPCISLPVKRTDGMWGVHVSSAIDRGAEWTREQRLCRLKRFVDTAIGEKLAAHIWLHPSLPQRDMEEVLFPLLKYCAAMREQGVLEILTMENLVSVTEKASQVGGQASFAGRGVEG